MDVDFLNYRLDLIEEAMYPTPTTCPICGGPLTVTRLHCRSCDTTIEGQFQGGRLSQLTMEQLQFVEVFLQCEGKIKAVENKLGLSYPTVRARLREVVRALGYETSDTADEPETLGEEERRQLLDDLAAGRVSSEDVLAALRGESN